MDGHKVKYRYSRMQSPYRGFIKHGGDSHHPHSWGCPSPEVGRERTEFTVRTNEQAGSPSALSSGPTKAGGSCVLTQHDSRDHLGKGDRVKN